MDEEMEDVFQKSFQCLEIDLEYEFDASCFFDFTRPESLAEARAAELWFETAASYPPSPFIAKLNLREDVVIRNSNVFSKPNDVEHSNPITTYSEIDMEPRFSAPKENGGWVFPDQITKGMFIAKTRSVFKAPFSSGSTLMKPTASQLAKQNRPREIKGPRQFIQRLQKPLVQKHERSLENPSKNESQASKRQRLEGGQSWKVYDIKQQTNLIHKVSKKQDEPIHDSTEQCRLKLTIPRGPELVTSQRARRMRPKTTTEVGEHVVSAAPMFKAWPLNKKILEAPSMLLPQKSTPRIPKFQEFDLKTSKRATQHLSTSSSSLPSSRNSDNVVHKHKSDFLKKLDTKNTKRSQHQDHIPSQPPKRMLNDDLRLEENETIPKFKARPLNKKILLSKGDIGVFCTSKRETTVPREFTFMTEKRFRQNPPVELFNKLSLTSEPKQNAVSQSTANQPFLRPVKNSKDMNGSSETHMITNKSTEELQKLPIKQSQKESEGILTEITSRVNMFSRSLGIHKQDL
ncbi:hypothetical protein AAC387_Pa06g0686 [Persea americana]